MCASATRWAKLGRLVFGATDPKAGYSLVTQQILHPGTEVKEDILNDECGIMLTDFFRRKRGR